MVTHGQCVAQRLDSHLASAHCEEERTTARKATCSWLQQPSAIGSEAMGNGMNKVRTCFFLRLNPTSSHPPKKVAENIVFPPPPFSYNNDPVR